MAAIFVTVPMLAQSAKVEGQFVRSDMPPHDFICGALKGWDIADANDRDAAQRDIGREIGAFMMQPNCEAGYVDCLVAYAIRCETIEEAEALPGFTHLFMHTGKQRELPR